MSRAHLHARVRGGPEGRPYISVTARAHLRAIVWGDPYSCVGGPCPRRTWGEEYGGEKEGAVVWGGSDIQTWSIRAVDGGDQLIGESVQSSDQGKTNDQQEDQACAPPPPPFHRPPPCTRPALYDDIIGSQSRQLCPRRMGPSEHCRPASREARGGQAFVNYR